MIKKEESTKESASAKTTKKDYLLFSRDTQAFIYNMQVNAAQRMLDFDYIARRDTPSVAAVSYTHLTLPTNREV